MDYEALLNLVRQRRSTRKFKTDPVPDEALEKIIEAARWAPSGANSQPWEFIVVKDKQIKDKIVDIVVQQGELNHRVELSREEDLRFSNIGGSGKEPGYKNAPVFIILCGDSRTQEAYPLITELTQGESIFTSSLANAFVYMALAAAALGLGAQWVTATASALRAPILKKYLSIPRQFKIYDMLAVGYPAAAPGPRLVRERTDMLHVDGFDHSKYRSDKEMRDFIQPHKTPDSCLEMPRLG
ncbi:MAG: nitroreductase family protein [Dehalococcoidia bacterium]|nr:nitroreductase family protein [Dehalococcoidia bacterium]